MSRWTITPPLPYVSGYSSSDSAPMLGMVRFSSTTRRFEIYNGSGWSDAYINNHPMMSQEFEDNMNWVTDQRYKDARIKELAKTHPAVKNAINAVEQAQAQLDIITALSQEQI